MSTPRLSTSLTGGASTSQEDSDRPMVTPTGAGHCPLCKVDEPDLRRHVYEAHLPWYTDPFRACWSCETHTPYDVSMFNHRLHPDKNMFTGTLKKKWGHLVIGALLFLSERLQRPGLASLHLLVHERTLYPECLVNLNLFTAKELDLFNQVDKNILGLGTPIRHKFSPPKGVISLMHWTILLSLLDLLKKEDQDEFQNYCIPKLPSGEDIPEAEEAAAAAPPPPPVEVRLPSLIDSHMHLDICFRRLEGPSVPSEDSSLDLLESRVGIENVNVKTVIANYVFPKQWSMACGHILNDQDNRVYATFGIHPNAAWECGDEKLDKLNRLLTIEKCVGIGEVGLDFLEICRCHLKRGPRCRCVEARQASQRRILPKLLSLACQHKKTLVIHTRGKNEGSDAADETLHFIRRFGASNLRIHCHCFQGSEKEVREWMNFLPFCRFGITAKNLFNSKFRKVISEIPLKRILLETDSPFLIPEGTDSQINTPWHLSIVAREVAKIKGVDPCDLVRQCNRNAEETYQLPTNTYR